MTALVVGQTLYMPASKGEFSEFTVTSIGRKWAYLARGICRSYGRCDMEVKFLDRGIYSAQRLYASKYEYLEEVALTRAFHKFLEDVRAMRIENVTLESIAAVRKILNLDEVAP